MKAKKLVGYFLLLFIMLIVTQNCTRQGLASGEDDVIYVFADSLDWLQYEDLFHEIFGQFVRTPLMESEYILNWKPFSEFETYKKFKNIFIVGRLDGTDPVSQNVQNLLNDEIIRGIEQGKYFYIPKTDVWATNQYMLIFVSTSLNDMIQKIIDLGDLAYRDFRNFYFKRLNKQLYKQMEQKKLQEHIENHFPFTLRIPHDFFIANTNLDENFIWIRRLDPDRSISVNWKPFNSDSAVTPQWIIAERNRLADIFYSGDRIVEEETRAYQTNFLKWNAIKLEGTWKNDRLIIGGPFQNYTFVDTTTRRIYMIDYYVQAIGKRKVPFLDQLTTMALTFDILDKPKQSLSRP